MNNAVYYELFDSAVNKFLIETGILDIAGANTVFLVASSGCNHFDEVAYPSDVEIGLSVSRIGSSAVTYHLGLFVAGAERTAATGTFIHVNVDAKTKRPCAIDDQSAQNLLIWLLALQLTLVDFRVSFQLFETFNNSNIADSSIAKCV